MNSYRRRGQKSMAKMNVNESVVGETIEMKMERILRNNEPISDLAPQAFTERKDGVPAQFNIRTDKWEEATDARVKVAEQRELFKKAKEEGKVVKLVDGKATMADKAEQGTGEATGGEKK